MVGGCGRPGASRGVLSFSLRSPLTEPPSVIDVAYWQHLAGRSSSRCPFIGLLIVSGTHPIPACRIVAVTLPPALDSAFMVSLIAATGAPWSPVAAARSRQRVKVCRRPPPSSPADSAGEPSGGGGGR